MKVYLDDLYNSADEFWEKTNARMGWTFEKKIQDDGKEPLFSSGCNFDEDVDILKDFLKYLNKKIKEREEESQGRLL
jgi:hypothetical protein